MSAVDCVVNSAFQRASSVIRHHLRKGNGPLLTALRPKSRDFLSCSHVFILSRLLLWTFGYKRMCNNCLEILTVPVSYVALCALRKLTSARGIINTFEDTS